MNAMLTLVDLLAPSERVLLDEIRVFELWALCEGFNVSPFVMPSPDDDPCMQGRRWQSQLTTKLWWAWQAGAAHGRLTP